MTITVDTALVCDQVRYEMNGKLFAIGIYSALILVPAFPAAVHLTALARIRADEAGQQAFPVRARLNDEVVFEAEGMVETAGPHEDWLPIPLPPLQIQGARVLSLDSKIGDEPWREFFRIRVEQGTVNAPFGPQPTEAPAS